MVQMTFVPVKRDAIQYGLAAAFIAEDFFRINPGDIRETCLYGLLEAIEIAQLRFRLHCIN